MTARRAACIALACIILPGAPLTAAPAPAPADMEARTQELQELRFGMFICWSFSTFSGYEWTWGVQDIAFFNPTGFDPDGWCRAARSAEMGYILFLTKHHDGFCLWDTDTTARNVTESPLGLDVLAEVKKACERHGLKLALYFSEGEFDWKEGGTKVPAGGSGYFRGGRNPELKTAQLRELLTRYGPIEFIWFDHAVGDGGLNHGDTAAFVKSLQPGCFVGFNSGDQTGADIRLGERGRPGPLDDPAAAGVAGHGGVRPGAYRLAEFTYPIQPTQGRGANWFYSLPENEDLCLSAEEIYRDYQGAEQFGNIFSLDVGPGRDGRLRAADKAALALVGRYIRGEETPPPPPPVPVSQGKPVTASSVWQNDPGYGPEMAVDGNPETRWGAAEDTREGWLEVDLGAPTLVTRAVIIQGQWERIEAYTLEAVGPDGPVVLAEGTELGATAEIALEPVTARIVRLRIRQAREVPTILEFRLY